MTLNEYNSILERAKYRYDQYNELQGDVRSLILRKEDDHEYWIAVVAYEQGKVAGAKQK